MKQHETTKKTSMLARLKRKNETDARRGIIDDMFDDFYARRRSVYRMNFVRGLFFGMGSVLGGTLLVASLVWILTTLTNFFPATGENIIQWTLDALSQAKR